MQCTLLCSKVKEICRLGMSLTYLIEYFWEDFLNIKTISHAVLGLWCLAFNSQEFPVGKAVSSALLYFTVGKILHRWSRRQGTFTGAAWPRGIACPRGSGLASLEPNCSPRDEPASLELFQLPPLTLCGCEEMGGRKYQKKVGVPHGESLLDSRKVCIRCLGVWDCPSWCCC